MAGDKCHCGSKTAMSKRDTGISGNGNRGGDAGNNFKSNFVGGKLFRFLSAAEPLDKLMGYFSFTFRDPGPSGNYTLLLKPTAHQIKKRLQSVEIEIDRHSLLPIRVAYAEPDGDSTEYSFSAIEMNKPQSAGLFDLALPPDVHIVQLKLGSGE